jgi:hypothetical protein
MWTPIATIVLSGKCSINFEMSHNLKKIEILNKSILKTVKIKYYNSKKNLLLSSSLPLNLWEIGSRGVWFVILGSEYLKSYIRPWGRKTPQVARRATRRRPQSFAQGRIAPMSRLRVMGRRGPIFSTARAFLPVSLWP